MSKLTKAQAKFLSQLAGGKCFPRHVLTGPETAMAQRLEARNLVMVTALYRETFWDITPAGREALREQS